MKALFLILCAIGVWAIWLVVSPEMKTLTWQAPTATQGEETVRTGVTEEAQSDTVIAPYDVMKNPFRYMGQSGILDTQHAMLVSSTGWQGVVPYPGGGLRFEKMLDEHTALFEVLAGGQSIGPEGEIAVVVSDSNPPDTMRFWRVRVVDSIAATNGFGARLNVAAVRFQGYYNPPMPKFASVPEPLSVQEHSVEPSPDQPNSPTGSSPSVVDKHTNGDGEESPAAAGISEAPTKPNEN